MNLINSEEEKKKKAEEEARLAELTDNEDAIKAYLEKDEPLSNDILDSVIGVLWSLEPFKFVFSKAKFCLY